MRTTEFKDTELGPVPKDWEVRRLGEESVITRGGSPRPIQAWLTDSVDGVNWVKFGDVSVGAKYITNTKERIVSFQVSVARADVPTAAGSLHAELARCQKTAERIAARLIRVILDARAV